MNLACGRTVSRVRGPRGQTPRTDRRAALAVAMAALEEAKGVEAGCLAAWLKSRSGAAQCALVETRARVSELAGEVVAMWKRWEA